MREEWHYIQYIFIEYYEINDTTYLSKHVLSGYCNNDYISTLIGIVEHSLSHMFLACKMAENDIRRRWAAIRGYFACILGEIR